MGLFLANPAKGMDLKSRLSADVGMGFDWVGQKYRLSDRDTLDQFDEKSLSTSLTYGGSAQGDLWVEEEVTLSDHSWKNLLTTAWSTMAFKEGQVKLENQLELKDYWWKGTDLFSSGYLEDRGKIEGRWPLLAGLLLEAEQRLTYVNYKKSSAYFRDNWLSESTARAEVDMGWMWDLVCNYCFALREVPDSSGMNYQSHSLNASLDGLVGWTLRLCLDGQLERRLSSGEETHEDYLYLTGQGELEYELGAGNSLVFKGEGEQMAYDHPDEV